MIGYALCGSFCTFQKSLSVMTLLRSSGFELQPIMSDAAFTTDTRFGAARSWVEQIETVCERPVIHTVKDAEPLGPSVELDALLISPCTGNTLAKMANGITDTAVCMAAKAHLRSDRPLLIALASNDAMSANLGNIGTMLRRKQVFFVPMHQDDPVKKPHSLVADFGLVPEALDAALEGRQLRKLFL